MMATLFPECHLLPGRHTPPRWSHGKPKAASFHCKVWTCGSLEWGQRSGKVEDGNNISQSRPLGRDATRKGNGVHRSGPTLAMCSSSSDNTFSSTFEGVSGGGKATVSDEARPAVGSGRPGDDASSGGHIPDVDRRGGGGGGGGGGGHDGGNGGFYGGERPDGGEDGGERAQDDEDFGPLLDIEQVQQEVQGLGVTLPPDMLEAAKTVGIRQLLLSRYIELQGAPWPLGPAVRGNALLRNRMLADPTFLFKVMTEVAIDSGCATFAEVQKRGKDFWNEFELYLSDLSVGIVLDVALVGLLAPFVRFGAVSAVSGTRGRLSRAIQALPSSMFEAQRPGRSFSLQQRVGTLFYKAGQYGVAGFACGMVGQGLASSVMTLKRKLKHSEDEEVEVPSIVKSAALWAVFMGVSSNTRYQIINGLERVVEGSAVSKRVPSIAALFTVGIRFANNIYGGMQFVDWARLAGVQ